MSVQNEIDRIITAVGNAYSKVSEKGGTVPASQTVANLATAIDSIPASSSPSLQSKSVTYTANGTSTITPDEGYDGLSSVNVTVDVSGGGSSGGGYLKDMQLENIPQVAFILIDMSVVSCAFVNGSYAFKTECSNVTFKDCLFLNCTIMCTQEIRDAIENGEGNSNSGTTWRII